MNFNSSNFILIIFIASGAFIFILGLILYKTKAIEMLSGYDSSKKYDREGLAKFNGKNLMYMGGLIVIINFAFVVIQSRNAYLLAINIIIFLVDVIFFTIRSVIGSKKYELSEDTLKSETEKNYNKIAIAAFCVPIIIIFSLTGAFTIEETLQSTSLTISNISLYIKAGAVDRDYDTNGITNVYLKNTIPEHSKSSGLGIGNIERGTYDVIGMGKGSVFLERDKGPYLYVIMGKDFVIINNKDVLKTEQFYKEIIKYWSRENVKNKILNEDLQKRQKGSR